MTQSCTLSLSCPIRTGVSARVSSFTAERGCVILEAQQFSDRLSGRFFMRVVFDPQDNSAETLRAEFAPLARQFEMEWQLRDPNWLPKVVLMVSAFDHCLGDLLYRMRIGEIRMEVPAIISNHPREKLTTSLIGDIPYHHLPITKDTKKQQEAQIREIVQDVGADLVVLARYMQIFSDEMVEHLRGRCINIHHSFLPGFKGAKPYHQAYERGVKMIGATSHYVTTDLDEGPIIAQDVEEIGHAELPEDLVAKGRDVERRVLAKAVNAHLQDRVFLNGNRTVVFEN
jgi:formyltetrahydrofolate deformylase